MGATVTVLEFEALLRDKSATVCDVRREADYQADPRTIAGAEWRNPEDVDVWAAQLPKDKPVAIYCVRGGSVSKSVQAALTGISGAVVGVVLKIGVFFAVNTFFPATGFDAFAVVIALLSLVALVRFKISMHALVGLSGLAGLLWQLMW